MHVLSSFGAIGLDLKRVLRYVETFSLTCKEVRLLC